MDVSSILDEVCRHARQLDPERAIECNAGTNLIVLGDRDAIKQVLLIVLDNALKHSTGNVELSAQQNGTHVEVKVRDFGEGIPSEKLEHVFDRFYRGNDTSTMPGFGLGLSIAKSLVDGMGGTIFIDSAPQKGTTVIIDLPSAIKKGDSHL